MSSHDDTTTPDDRVRDDDGTAARLVDVSGLPAAVADAITALIGQHAHPHPAGAATTGTGVETVNDAAGSDAYRAHLGDLVQAAEAVKSFGEASLLEATAALVADVAADHGIARDDPRYAGKVAAHRKSACRAVVHEIQLLTGSTLTGARDRVRFATALPERVAAAQALVRSGGCSWERARIAFAETAHLDPVLAGEVITRLLAPPERTTTPDGDDAHIPLSHAGFRARIRRQLALIDGAKKDRARRHAQALDARDACTFPGPDGTATLSATGDATRVFTAQQRLATLARAAKAAGDPRTLAQLRADLALDLLIRGTVPGDEHLGHAPTGRLHVIVPLTALLPEDLMRAATAQTTGATAAAAAGAAFGLAEVPGLGFLTPEQIREVALQAGSTWTRLVTDPVTGQVIDAATSYRAPAAMARLVQARDHTCRAPGDCAVPAGEADLDHDTPFQAGATRPADGATHPDNLHLLHRGHHHSKTGRFWTSRQHPDASVTWHTLTRRLRTTPFDHHRPADQAPPWTSPAEQQLGIHLAAHHEHDLTPNVFTDLADLDLLHDNHDNHGNHGNHGNHAPGHDNQQDRDDERLARRHHLHIHRHNGPHVEFPDPSPPF